MIRFVLSFLSGSSLLGTDLQQTLYMHLQLIFLLRLLNTDFTHVCLLSSVEKVMCFESRVCLN